MVANLAEARSHNVPPETFLKYYREIRDAQRAKDDAGMALARAKKAAKNGGVDLPSLKLIEDLSKLDDDEAEIRLRKAAEYALILKLPIGTQLTLFSKGEAPEVDPKVAEEHAAWEAGDAGIAAGRSGAGPSDNPHKLGTELAVAWEKSRSEGYRIWLAAQGQIADEMADSTTEKKRGRGRPRKGVEEAATSALN